MKPADCYTVYHSIT